MLKKLILTLMVLFIPVVAFAYQEPVDCNNYPWPCNLDLQQKSWPEAFEILYEKISTEYPYTSWRNIEWEKLYTKYSPEVQKAYEKHDYLAYYIAVSHFLSSVHDGHVRVNVDPSDSYHASLIQIQINSAYPAGYGFTLQKKNNQYIVKEVIPGSEAFKAGIIPGIQITEWNNALIQNQIDGIDLTWINSSEIHIPSTDDDLNYQKMRFLARAPLQTPIKVSYRNLSNLQQTTTLYAVNTPEQNQLNDSMNLITQFNDNSDTVQYKILATTTGHKVGYIKILALQPNPLSTHTQNDDQYLNVIKNAIISFQEQNAVGIIIDLQGALGGKDILTAKILGHFVSKKTDYVAIEAYNYNQAKIVRAPGSLMSIEPIEPVWTGGPVVCLTNMETISAAEGLAYGLKNFGHAKILSYFASTHGSFGAEVTGIIHMPDGLLIDYPGGRMVSPDGKILIDSDRSGKGGVLTDTQIFHDNSIMEKTLKFFE